MDTSSQASAHFPLSPVSASNLAQREVERRNSLRRVGPCKSGCSELDDYVLQTGGFERGCVVGVSAEEESTGIALGLQALSRELLDRPSSETLLITPRPAAEVLHSLRDSLRSQLREDVSSKLSNEDDRQVKSCLDRVLLSCVFDMDGLWEVLRDVDAESSQQKSENSLVNAVQESPSQKKEIQDSEEEESPLPSLSPPPPPPPPRNQSHPSIILITHFSTLLSTLFTQREKDAAHSTLALLNAHLRHLSRSLSSNPLILLLNSVTDSSHQDISSKPQSTRHNRNLDPSLQSIFNPPPLPIPGYNTSGAHRRTKPAFGLVFTQLLDLHLLCSRVPRTRGDADLAVRSGERDREVRYVTLVEVLMDEMGLWQGKRGPRPSREQRWTAVEVVKGKITGAM